MDWFMLQLHRIGRAWCLLFHKGHHVRIRFWLGEPPHGELFEEIHCTRCDGPYDINRHGN